MYNAPDVKIGIVAVSRDCFPESLSVNRRKALVEAYTKKYDASHLHQHEVRRLRRNSNHYPKESLLEK